MAVAALSATPAGAQGCTEIGPSIYCGTEAAHSVLGRSAIFRTGRPGELAGGRIYRETPRGPTLGQLLNRRPSAPVTPAPDRPRAPGRYVDLQRGKDFGAFAFPLTNRLGATISGARPGRLSPRLPAFQR